MSSLESDCANCMGIYFMTFLNFMVYISIRRVMSCQAPHWVKRNISPAMQGPLKATVPVSFMKQNSCSLSRNTSRRSSSKSPNCVSCNDIVKTETSKSTSEKRTNRLASGAEKSKTLNFRSQPQEHLIRRTASLDALYLSSQWQANAIFFGYCGRLMIDRSTQTPKEWNETDKKKLQRKPPLSSGDHLEVKYIKQKLQRTNQINREANGLQRYSHVQGNHLVVSSSNNVQRNAKNSTACGSNPLHPLSNSSQHGVIVSGNLRAGSVPASWCLKSHLSRTQNSTEGLNQEIEKLVLKESYELDKEKDAHSKRVIQYTPEGHHAPIADLLQSDHIGNIHSSHVGKDYCVVDNPNHSHSSSPTVSIIAENSDISISPVFEGAENLRKFDSSPHISQFSFRGPPDGCEKVKIFDEPRIPVDLNKLPESVALKPRVTCVLLPSQSSAFCPLHKEMPSGNQPLDSFTLVPSQSFTNILF